MVPDELPSHCLQQKCASDDAGDDGLIAADKRLTDHVAPGVPPAITPDEVDVSVKGGGASRAAVLLLHDNLVDHGAQVHPDFPGHHARVVRVYVGIDRRPETVRQVMAEQLLEKVLFLGDLSCT